MGRALTPEQRRIRRNEDEAAQDRKYAKQDKREETKRKKEEDTKVHAYKANQYKVNSYDLFKEVLFSFHKKNLIEHPSMANLKAISNIYKPKPPINITFNTTKYQHNQSLIAKKNRLKKWSKDSYDDWCKKEEISSSLLSNIFNGNEE